MSVCVSVCLSPLSSSRRRRDRHRPRSVTATSAAAAATATSAAAATATSAATAAAAANRAQPPPHTPPPTTHAYRSCYRHSTRTTRRTRPLEVLWTPPTWSNGRDAHVREGGRVALASPLVGRRASNVGPGPRDVRPRVVWEHAALDLSPRARRRALTCCAHMLVQILAVLKGRLVRGARGVCPRLCSSMLIMV